MITVKIRDIFTAEGVKLAQIPFSELDAFIGRLRQEGVNIVGQDTTYEINTQWVVDEAANEAYLDIIAGEENE